MKARAEVAGLRRGGAALSAEGGYARLALADFLARSGPPDRVTWYDAESDAGLFGAGEIRARGGWADAVAGGVSLMVLS